jgi:phosphate transport system permease protein
MKLSLLEHSAYWLIRIITYAVVLVVVWILVDVLWMGIPVISWEFVFGYPREGLTEGGIFPAIVGTMALVAGTMAIAFPLGIASAVYLSEYAAQSPLVRLIRSAIATLAAVPSIVFGLFGFGLFVLYLGLGASLLAGCLTLACMILPTIIVGGEEALREVPRSLRDGSLALGATRWQTVRHNVLPYSLPGMIAGSILAVGRVAGETAPILLTVAAFYIPRLPRSLSDQVMTLPYHLYALATQHPETTKVRPMLYGTAAVLLTLVLGLSLIAILLRGHFRKRFRW